jgi:hypothetical protein
VESEKARTLHVPVRVLGLQLEVNRIRQSLVKAFHGRGADLGREIISPSNNCLSVPVTWLPRDLSNRSVDSATVRLLAFKPLWGRR